LYLHMGYFATLADAQKWVQVMRGRYPNAVVSATPAALLRPRNPTAPAAQPAEPRREVQSRQHFAPVNDESLTDTQVMKILEKRGVSPSQHDADQGSGAPIALLRPEDTSTRRALKEAVIQGAPVSFAVQLSWSAQPIDMRRVPSLPIFKEHTLYTTESSRQGRSCYFLRLGFFADPSVAKEIANQVRSKFASAAVVPIAEQELTSASENRVTASTFPHWTRQFVDRALETYRRTRSLAASARASAALRSYAPPNDAEGAETLEQTLELLAQKELLTDTDSLSETGVRHLKIEVQD